MTTAQVKHRDYVPWGWIAIEFCDVEFFGERAKELKDKWSDITMARYRKYKGLVEELETKKSDLENEHQRLVKELKSTRRWYRFWYNEKENQLEKQVYNTYSKIQEIDKDIEKYNDMCFYGSIEKRLKLEKFLQEQGLVLDNSNAVGDECITYIDIWKDGK